MTPQLNKKGRQETENLEMRGQTSQIGNTCQQKVSGK